MSDAITKIKMHSELLSNLDIYQKIAHFEAGDIPTLANNYLIPYGSEADKEPRAIAHFVSRKERLRNDNFVKQYHRLHLSHLTQQINFSGVEDNDKLSPIYKDATGFGWSAQQAFRETLSLFIRDGRVAVLVDGPPDIASSDVEAREFKEQSYQVIYAACDILDWEYFSDGPRRGQLKRVVFPNGLVSDGKEVYKTFKVFIQPEEKNAPYYSQVYKSTVAGSNSNAIKDGVEVVALAPPVVATTEIIPVIIIGDGPSQSFVRDIAEDNRAHLNLQSVLDNVLYYGGMQKHIFAGMTREEIDKWSESAGILTGSPDAQVFTISPVYPQGLLEVLAKLEVRIHRRGKFQFNQLADDTRQVQSAESKTQDLAVQRDLYDQTLDLFQEALGRIWAFHARFEGVPVELVSVNIARDYGFDNPADKQAKKDSLWNKARELKAVDIQKQILKLDVLEMDLVTREGESLAETRTRLLEQIDSFELASETAIKNVSGLGAKLFG